MRKGYGKNPAPDIIEGNDEITSLVVTLSVDDNARAISFPGNGSRNDEKRIYNAIAVAFDKNGTLETIAEYDEFRNGGAEAENIVLEFPEISTGPHTFYVLANAGRSLLERKDELFAKGMNVNTFREKTVILADMEDVIRKQDNDVIQPGNISESSRGFLMSGDKAYALNLTAEGNNVLTAQLVRVVAKVSVGVELGANSADLRDVKWYVRNNPKEIYISPVLSSTGYVLMPFFSEPYSSNNYLAASKGADGYQKAITSATADAEKAFSYAAENSNVTPALQGNSTMVMIKGTYVPDEVLDADGNPDNTYTAGKDFYRLRDINLGGYQPEFYSAVPNDIPTGHEVVKYENGLSYYGAWLKDSHGDYLVKRNSYVKLTITDVSGPGDSDEEEVIDPPKPIEETTDATIKMEVKEWEGFEYSTSI